MKKIFISPYSVGFFSAMQEVGNIDFLKTYSPDIQFCTWFYSSVVQSGANFIELIDDPHNVFSQSEFIKKRLLNANRHDYRKISDRVSTIFDKYINTSKDDPRIKDDIVNTRILITDIIYSLENGCDLIYTQDIPTLSNEINLVSPDLIIPLQNLLSSIQSNDVFVPSPISIVSKKEMRVFNNILDSDIYKEYSHSQEGLWKGKISEVFEDIKLSAEHLVASKPAILGLYNNMTSLLPLTKLVFPKLGELGKDILEAVQNANDINGRSNLIIHRYKDVTLEHFKSKFEISMGRFEEDVKNWIIEGLIEAKNKHLNWNDAQEYVTKYWREQKKLKLGITQGLMKRKTK